MSSSGLSDKPVLNKQFVEYATSILSAAKSKGKAAYDAAANDGNMLPWWTLGLIILACVAGYIFYGISAGWLETPPNIQTYVKNAMKKSDHYSQGAPNRMGIRRYIQQLKGAGLPDNHLAVTNFYGSAINAAGIYLPPVDGVVTPYAIRSAFDAGARAYVFDIWPDMTPGANFGPIIQIVESGSLWRRISVNSLPFSSILKELISSGLENTASPGYEDPLFLYIRFRGTPRRSTYDGVASALRAIIEPYRLDQMYNACRNQENLFKIPITDLFRKVLVFSNRQAQGTSFADYVNAAPSEGIDIEYATNMAKGLNTDARAIAVRKIKQNFAFVAPVSESPDTNDNKYDYHLSYDVGIHFCSMNFWNQNDKLKSYMSADRFGKCSYQIKPVELRYFIDVLANPKYLKNPDWGTGTSAGTPYRPADIRLP
jgi:hypothetical protein